MASTFTRKDLIAKLNEDLAREYQAIIAYVVYSQVLKGATYMNIAAELKRHAAEELSHAITIAGQIDYLGGMPGVTPKVVKTSEKAEEMLLDCDAKGALPGAIHCPECKSLRVQYPQFAHKSVIPNVIVGLMATFGGQKEFYCEDCHYTWPMEGTKISAARPHSAPYYFIEGIPQTPPGTQPTDSHRQAA